MPLSLAVDFKNSSTTKLPLLHYERWLTYVIALAGIATNLYFGKADKLVEVLLGQIVFCYLLIGTLGEVYFYRRFLADDSAAKTRRYEQSRQEIVLATEALIGVCAFSCCWYEVVDPKYCPWHGYFDSTPYTASWCAANVAFYLVACDVWFYWWHWAFHVFEALWPMHYQHHQLREPTSFGGPTVHVVELLLEYTLCHHLVQWVMPFHPNVHRALGAFAFIFGAVFNHGGLSLDYNDHYAHHITWKRGKAHYCNYGMFFPLWDVLNGTRYYAAAPPASAAKPKEMPTKQELLDVTPHDAFPVGKAE